MKLAGYLGALYEAAEMTPTQADSVGEKGSLTYQQIREKLADTKIYVVPYAHSDWSWVHTRQWQEDRDNLIFHEVLDILQHHPEYRWFLDTENEILKPFLDRSPDRAEELRGRVREGKVGISGGTICNQHPHWMEGEAFIWNMVLGRRYFEQHFPDVALDAMTLYDVCAGYSQVPQLLAKGGYKYYRFWRPGAALNAKGIPRQFRWEGLDGTEILCSRGTYGGLIWREDILQNFTEDWERAVEKFYQRVLVPIMNVETSNFIWISNGADDTRPLRAFVHDDPSEPVLAIPEFIREWNKREKIPLRFATPLEFFNDLEVKRNQLPVVHGVLDPVGWTYWYGMNGNNGLRLWRTRSEELLIGAQKYLALSILFGDPYPERRLEELWFKLLTAYSHAQMWLFEDDYQKHLNVVKNVANEAADLENEGLQRLAGRIRVRSSEDAVVVFNPLPWERRDVVRLHPTFLLANTENVAVRDAQGNQLPAQLEERNFFDGSRFLKEVDIWTEVTVPPLGYTTVYLERRPGESRTPNETSPSPILGVDPLIVHLDHSGLPTILDHSNDVEYPGAGQVIYQVVRDTGPLHYGPIVRELFLEGAEVSWSAAGPVRWVAEVKGMIGPHALGLRVIVYPKQRRVVYESEIESQGGDGYFLTTVGFPYAGQITAHVPFGAELRDLAKEPYSADAPDDRGWSVERLRHNVFYAGHWVDVSDGKRGLALLGTKGEKGYVFDPEQRRLGHYLLQTIRHSQADWERFCNHYMEGKGRHLFSCCLMPHQGDWKQANIPRAALEVDYPLRSVNRNSRAKLSETTLPEKHSFMECSPDHVLFSSLFSSQGKWIIRLYESKGESASVRLVLPKRFSTARETDFNGRPLAKQITLEPNGARLEMKPWEIVTLELT
jgi:hypothetical protein